ncbi:alpha/beta-hydrolase [Byssothecium circinans]|uniref:Alpha/beta-hydrolase n=1 Tax=Byssothecium circinans TaxID=147558 RepID=A0A6A5U840_9PLEO|nr:alpha/beta-hydrolase [Byssothecium circinans]
MDSTQWKAYGKIDPELEAVSDSASPTLEGARRVWLRSRSARSPGRAAAALAAGISKPADFTGVSKKEIEIPVRDGTTIRAVVYKPEASEPGPLFLYYHGGGWVVGEPEAYEAGFSVLTKDLGATVVGVGYRKAPEYVFPTAAHDSIDAAKWVGENASQLGADTSKGFIVSGSSAGGNLAAVVTHEAADKKWSPPITGVFLSIPSLVHPEAVTEKYKSHYNAWEDNKDSLILDQKNMLWFYEQYKADPNMDPLRDDGENGVPTKVDMYSGMPHGAPDFMVMLSVAKKALQDLKGGVEWLLSQNSRSENL